MRGFKGIKNGDIVWIKKKHRNCPMANNIHQHGGDYATITGITLRWEDCESVPNPGAFHTNLHIGLMHRDCFAIVTRVEEL